MKKEDQRVAIYLAESALAKKKEKATKAIKLLLSFEELEGHRDILKAVEILKGFRKSLDEI